MNRIDERFRSLKRKGAKALITFITAGDPSLKMTEELVLEMDRRGLDIVELGVPFSDPIADGPVIQASSLRSLKRGTTLPKILGTVRLIRKKSDIPLCLMSYFNPIYVYGIKKFVKDSTAAGVDGVIVPDLPPEEAQEIINEGRRFGLATIFFLAPTSTKERMEKVIDASSGFIYYVSLTGVTGERKGLSADLSKKLKEIKSMTRKPIAVGFGISRPSQIKAVSKNSDGVIVGSALVRIMEKFSKNKKLLFREFIKKIDSFLDRA